MIKWVVIAGCIGMVLGGFIGGLLAGVAPFLVGALGFFLGGAFGTATAIAGVALCKVADAPQGRSA